MHTTVKCPECGTEQKLEKKYDLLKSVRDALVTANTGIAGQAHTKKVKAQCPNCGKEFEVVSE